MLIHVTLVCCCAVIARATLMDNKIQGTPAINCGREGLSFEMETEKPFEGQLYVMNEYKNEKCKSNFKDTHTSGGSMAVKFSDCGMRRQRMLNPKGMAYTVTMMIKFHNIFVTSADRAYEVQCFYRELEATVTADMSVSQIQTESMKSDFPLPRCFYDIRQGHKDGDKANFVRVGDPIVHVFRCENAEVYGMLVKDCYVDNGKQEKEKIIDSDGCPTDSIIMTAPEYSDAKAAAVVQATVFKWPDEPSMFFSCQILLCLRESGECDNITPPKCDKRRVRRSAANLENASTNFMELDVAVQKLLILELDDVPTSATTSSPSENISSDRALDLTSNKDFVTGKPTVPMSTISSNFEQIPLPRNSTGLKKQVLSAFVSNTEDSKIEVRHPHREVIVRAGNLGLTACLGTGTVVAFSVVLTLVTLLLLAITIKLCTPVLVSIADSESNGGSIICMRQCMHVLNRCYFRGGK